MLIHSRRGLPDVHCKKNQATNQGGGGDKTVSVVMSSSQDLREIYNLMLLSQII